MLKRLLIPPLIPVLLLVVLSTVVILGDVGNIDGRPDDAPRNAAVILVFLSPVFYLVFGVLNGIENQPPNPTDSAAGAFMPAPPCSTSVCFKERRSNVPGVAGKDGGPPMSMEGPCPELSLVSLPAHGHRRTRFAAPWAST